MRKNILWFSLAALMAGSVAAYSDYDLSGSWQLQMQNHEGEGSYAADLQFVATPFKSALGGDLWLVEGAIGDWHVWGASVEWLDNNYQLVWWGHRDQEFLGESNIILGVWHDEISLGGNEGGQEIAKMVKIQQWSYEQ